MHDRCEQNAPAPKKLGYIGRMKELRATLERANGLLVEIVGPPLDGQNDISKEANNLTESLSAELWDAQGSATTVVQQLERLHEELA
jgi:hypothetical protein